MSLWFNASMFSIYFGTASSLAPVQRTLRSVCHCPCSNFLRFFFTGPGYYSLLHKAWREFVELPQTNAPAPANISYFFFLYGTDLLPLKPSGTFCSHQKVGRVFCHSSSLVQLKSDYSKVSYWHHMCVCLELLPVLVESVRKDPFPPTEQEISSRI